MKHKLILLTSLTLLLFSFKKAFDVLEQVGATMEEVKQNTLEQVYAQQFGIPYYTENIKAACRKLPPGVREATMLSIGKVIKDYVNSPAFTHDYMALLDERLPKNSFDPNDPRWVKDRKDKTDELTEGFKDPATAAIYVQMLDQEEQNATSFMQGIKDMGPLADSAVLLDFQRRLKEARLLKSLYAQDKNAFKEKYIQLKVEAYMNSEMGQEKIRYEQDLKERKQREDYKAIIRQELQQFLDLSENIDFNAQLKPQGGKMVFVNPAYERQPFAWKFYYRCGREATTGARNFARQWLNELNH